MGVSNKRKQEIAHFLSKENLEKYLIIYSANYIAKTLFPDFKTTAGTVIDIAKRYGIKTHNFSSAKKLKTTIFQVQNTLKNKYGVDNPSKAQFVKNKKEAKALEKYGVRNVFQSEEIKSKIYKTCLEKYGVEKIGETHTGKNSGKRSNFHKKIEQILISLSITFESEKYSLFKKYNTFLKKIYSPIVDILLTEYKIVIECNGDYWHANPKIYKSSDIFHTFSGVRTAKDIWGFDKSRKEQIESFGYIVITIWESDYNKDFEIIKGNILNAIKNQKNNKIV